jgi:hypothetical protein
MLSYHIVKIGAQPGNEGSENEGATCAAWVESANKQSTEVIAVDLSTGEVVRHYMSTDAEEIARAFRHPRI